MKFRHKGRDYEIKFIDIVDTSTTPETLRHRLQIVSSATGRNVRVYLDGKQLT